MPEAMFLTSILQEAVLALACPLNSPTILEKRKPATFTESDCWPFTNC